MNITKIESYPYELKFKTPFKTAKEVYEYRHGFIIKMFSDSFIGIGEVSPLGGFNKESLQECYYAFEGVNQFINNSGYIDKDELFDIFQLHSESKPSLLFGLETALLDILSQENKQPLNKFLNAKSINKINLNGIESIHDNSSGFNVIKIKLGYQNLYDDIEKMEKLSSVFSEKVKFRIDVNGQLDLTKAIRFCKSMEKFNIDYIEQPLSQDNLEDLSELRLHTEVKIAVDESLTDIESAHKIIDNQSADVFVIKPMITGSYSSVNKIIEVAQKNDIECIITNMLDSAINRMACIHIASANNINSACGISGDNLFDVDIASTPEIINGQISIPIENHGLGITLND